MSNVLNEEKKQQVIALGKLGWPLRRIEQATGVRRETASAYLKAAGVVVCLPGWGRRAPAKPAMQVTTDLGAPPGSQRPPGDSLRQSASTCESYRELIEQGLSRDRNAMAIWQDLVSDCGFAGSYQTVKRFVRKLRGPQRPEAAGIILTAAGEEAQVDYGSGPMVRDPHSGKYRRTRLFVMTLGYSRKSVRLLAWRSSARIWAELHEQAFRRLGSCPRVVVLDNLKEGVLVPDIYDPTVNPLFREVLAHYGVVALPCRIITGEQKDVLNWLARKAVPPDMVVTADPLLGFLVSTYTRVRSWAGSGVSTPDFDLRTRESQQAFQNGVTLPAWESMHVFYIQRSGQDTLWKPPQNCSDVFHNAKYDVWECPARGTSNMQTETTTF